MSTDTTVDVTKEMTTILTQVVSWLKNRVVGLLGGLVLAVAAVVWRSPTLFVALLASSVMIAAVLHTLAYIRLHTKARAREQEALAEVEHLRIANLTGQRRLKMLEESLYHVLLAWMGNESSPDALSHTLPHNGLVRQVVDSLANHEQLPWDGDRVNAALERVQAEREQIEQLIGPERVQRKLTIGFTTHDNRRVERVETSDLDTMDPPGP